MKTSHQKQRPDSINKIIETEMAKNLFLLSIHAKKKKKIYSLSIKRSKRCNNENKNQFYMTIFAVSSFLVHH